MPELPEVEVIRSGLSELIAKKTIEKVNVLNAKSFQASTSSIDVFVNNSTILSVKRRAKILLIELSSGYSLIIHLKMTGQLLFRDNQNKSKNFAGGHPSDSFLSVLPDNHTRVELIFTDSTTLFFNDMRKFGWIKLLPTTELKEEKFIAKLGPEPLIGNPTPEYLKRISRHPKSLVKAALLNQEIVAGIGNIYADEALWSAMIHPKTRVENLSEKQLEDILNAAIEVMSFSINKGGSTDRNYLNAKGEKGSYLTFANVFRKEGKPCPRCGHVIEKIRVAGRGTHICSNCQQLV